MGGGSSSVSIAVRAVLFQSSTASLPWLVVIVASTALAFLGAVFTASCAGITTACPSSKIVLKSVSMITLGAWAGASCALIREHESNIAKATAIRIFTRGNMVFLLSVSKTSALTV